MNKLNKGTKVKVALVMDKVNSVTINFDGNDNVKETILDKEPLFIAELKEDLPLENFEDTDNRLVYSYKNINYISDKIENITLTKKMKLPHDIDVYIHNERTDITEKITLPYEITEKITIPYDIEINLHKERYLIETESNAYYIELLNQGN